MGIRKVSCLLLLFGSAVLLSLDIFAQESLSAANDVSFDKDIGTVKMRGSCRFTDRLLFRCSVKPRPQSVLNVQYADHGGNLSVSSPDVSLIEGNVSQNRGGVRAKYSAVGGANISSSKQKSKRNEATQDPKQHSAVQDSGSEKRVAMKSPSFLRSEGPRSGNLHARRHSYVRSKGPKSADSPAGQHCPFWKRWSFSCGGDAAPLTHLGNIEISGMDDKGGKLAYRAKSKRFTQVVCTGGLSILLDPNGPEGQVRASSSHVNYSDSGSVLRLDGEHGNGHDVVISGRKLVGQIQSVALNDSCSLDGHDLSQSKWHLDSRTTGDIVLRGMFKQFAITQTGDNRVDLYWVDSGDVDIYSESGVMRLAGVVEKSRVRCLGNSQLLLKQLRAKNGWLSASDDAYVEMFGSKRFIVFMSGHSQVLSEGVPLLVNEFSKKNSMYVVDD